VKGDFSRLTFQPRQHYARVLQQQGRPQLDADWNEQVAILLHRLEMMTGDLIGDAGSRSGAPVDAAGFEIGPVPGEADNFTISRGRYYIDGLCCECDEDTTYVEQPLPTGTKPDRDRISLVYLDVWDRLSPASKRHCARASFGRSTQSACRKITTRERQTFRHCGRNRMNWQAACDRIDAA